MKSAVPEFDISISVKPEFTWVRTLEDTVRSYLTARDFPGKLIEQTSAAVVEAAEQLIALCNELNNAEPFNVGFAWNDEVVHVHFSYDASIPLNPHQEPDYEVPSAEADSEDTLEGLWLHIIKRNMDRVFFRIDGKQASLVMMRYCRAEQHARKLWFMGLAPKLRADLVIECPTDKTSRLKSGNAIIHDTLNRKVLKLSPSDVFILSRLDGVNTLEDIYLEHAVEWGPISPDHVKRLYETLEASSMLEGTSERGQGKERLQRWFSPVFSIPHPDAAVTWIYRHVRFMFSPVGISVLVLIGLSGLIPLFMNRNAIVHIFQHIDGLFLRYPAMIVMTYLLMLANAALHEFAHGAACKHFGGQVNKLGIMWYMAMFIFFCDTTSAWTFPKKSHRIWVSLAGPLVSWAVFGVTAWCAGITAASGSQWAALWIALVIVNAFGLLMNFNPLIKMDAYYILMDWTEIPNLQKKSFNYLKTCIFGRIRGTQPAAEAVPPSREKRIYMIYGILSGFMSVFFILLPFWRLADLWMTGRRFTVWGAIGLITVVLVIGGMAIKAYNMLYAARHREYKIL